MHRILLLVGRWWNNAWAGAHGSYVILLDKLQKRICRTFGPSLASLFVCLFVCLFNLFKVGVIIYKVYNI